MLLCSFNQFSKSITWTLLSFTNIQTCSHFHFQFFQLLSSTVNLSSAFFFLSFVFIPQLPWTPFILRLLSSETSISQFTFLLYQGNRNKEMVTGFLMFCATGWCTRGWWVSGTGSKWIATSDCQSRLSDCKWIYHAAASESSRQDFGLRRSALFAWCDWRMKALISSTRGEVAIIGQQYVKVQAANSVRAHHLLSYDPETASWRRLPSDTAGPQTPDWWRTLWEFPEAYSGPSLSPAKELTVLENTLFSGMWCVPHLILCKENWMNKSLSLFLSTQESSYRCGFKVSSQLLINK